MASELADSGFETLQDEEQAKTVEQEQLEETHASASFLTVKFCQALLIH
jgi:hypothetical protein